MRDGSRIITHSNSKSPISEAYRVLRTNIQYSGVDKPLKIIVTTSSGPMEGKTTTIANLAITFAQTGCKVLLIDADLRKPRIHKLFMLSNTVGLTNYLTSHEPHPTFIQHSSIENLDILTSGTIPPNPSELLASNAMKQFIEKIKDEYDVILLDSPPVGGVTDACIISTYVDGTILVVKSGKVGIEAAKRTKEMLDKVNANIIGVVLNSLDKKRNRHYYNYQYYYYSEENQDTKGYIGKIKRCLSKFRSSCKAKM